MDFSPFNQRPDYPVTTPADGYTQWADTYDDSVHDQMDLRLLERFDSVQWAGAQRAADLACGSGRIGAWLKRAGVTHIDGQDLTPAMLQRARQRELYHDLQTGDLRETPFEPGAYDLVTCSLADEHLPDLPPMFAEAARLLRPGGAFVNIGMHPQFLTLRGMPTHFHRAGGEPVAIETHLHTLEDHTRAARRAGLSLDELHEGLIDDDYLAVMPKWAPWRNTPITLACAWRKRAD